ncbi:MAG: heme-binding protein [Rhodobacter sp.]|nr:heme-binding protein [Rhodobacter sp.]
MATIPVTPPTFPATLINEPAQANPPAPTTALGPIEALVGTWTNKDLANGKGGQASPYSYNVMPLPQVDASSPQGYILKNFSYYEEITFSPIHGTAPNRGGTGTQVANTLFYEQRVYFAEGPDKDKLVHAENGSWLFLSDRKQHVGPYGATDEPNSTPPTQPFDLVKQISVPHGNSILAGGSAGTASGAPTIPAADILPSGVDTSPYTTQSVGNPNLALTANPNQALTDALGAAPVQSYMTLQVDSAHAGYEVTNIPFEEKHANVTRYYATYWLESLNSSGDFTQLQYSQTMLMTLMINGQPVSFPHVTANTLTKI